tara:strand:- start:366 stop:851 length:486 start_codon:yes stop_codon:yes gene_type:complete
MRRYKVVTTRYHVLSIVEIDDLNQEATCNTVSQNERGMYPTSTTAFLFEGGTTAFLPTAQGQWEYKSESAGPAIQFVSGNVVIGSSTTSVPYRVVGIQPKKREILEAWEYTPEQVDLIMNTNTENQFIDILTFNRDQKMNSDTFEKMNSDDIVSDDEISFI